MGKGKGGKRSSMKKQAVDALAKQAKFGQKKHEAKTIEREQCRETGEVWNPARTEGIYSLKTMEAYIDRSVEFVTWAKEAHSCKWLEECKQYVPEYIHYRIEKGHSAWTLQQTRAALRKMYQDHQLAQDVVLPIRHKAEVARSRMERAMDKDFSEKNNRSLVDFCKATGLRRHEIKALRVSHLYEKNEKMYVMVERGKGGRGREVPVLEAYQERVRVIAAGRESNEVLFERIPVRADIHGYRREYAQERYQELTGGNYSRENRSEAALRELSQNLGHNRIDVCTRSYL